MSARAPRNTSGARAVAVSPGKGGRKKVRMRLCGASRTCNEPYAVLSVTVEVITLGGGHPVRCEQARPCSGPGRVVVTMPLTSTARGSLA